MKVLTVDEYTELFEKYPNVLIFFNRFFEEAKNSETSNNENSLDYKEYLNSLNFNINAIASMLEKNNNILFSVVKKYVGTSPRETLSKISEDNMTNKVRKIYYDIIELCFSTLNDTL